MNSCQLHSEADASKDGLIRPHIRQAYPAGAKYGRILKFGRISTGAGAGAGYDIRCNLQLSQLIFAHSLLPRS